MTNHKTHEDIFNALKILLLLLFILLLSNRMIFGAEPPKELVKWGVPDDAGQVRKGYIIATDGRTRSARWVLEHLNSRSLAETVKRDTESFKSDSEMGEEFRATAADYRGSGFDIGHLVPANNHRASQEELDATFLFSNATPQLPQFNRGLWKSLESQVHETAKESPVWVITAPLWIPEKGVLKVETIGPHGVWVPSHCGKAVLIEREEGIELRAWIMPNSDLNGRKLSEFQVSVDEFEKAAGFDCWAELPDDQESKLESGWE